MYTCLFGGFCCSFSVQLYNCNTGMRKAGRGKKASLHSLEKTVNECVVVQLSPLSFTGSPNSLPFRALVTSGASARWAARCVPDKVILSTSQLSDFLSRFLSVSQSLFLSVMGILSSFFPSPLPTVNLLYTRSVLWHINHYYNIGVVKLCELSHCLSTLGSPSIPAGNRFPFCLTNCLSACSTGQAKQQRHGFLSFLNFGNPK